VDAELVRFSRFLSRVLRHRPESIQLELDDHGWARVDELVVRANVAGVALTREILDEVVARNDKQRFAYDADQTRIRARQGHSIPVDLGLAPVAPPDVLYHGTGSRAVDSIRSEGLTPHGRQHVHLSADLATAIAVGRRHGRPVVFTVDAAGMQRDGHPFYRSENGVWLAAAVPVRYLRVQTDDD